MKLRTFLILLFLAFFWTSPATAFNPAEPFVPENAPVHDTLKNIYEDFFPAEVFEATEGVYVARGFNRDNPVLIVGPNGLIVVDPGESIEAAEIVKAAFNEHPDLEDIFDKKPVKAIIYTHHHDCHIHGASVFAGKHTEIIAHENMMETLYYDWYNQVYPSRAMGGVKMMGGLFATEIADRDLNKDGYDDGWYYGGALVAGQIQGDSGFLPPTKTVKDALKTTIAGVNVHLFSAPGETRDVLVIWLPDKKTLVQIANLYEAFPAINTLRGHYPRDPLSYINSIDLYRSLNPECLVLVHGPRPVWVGKDQISDIFTNYRDAIQFVHDQTVQYMNKGLTPAEIAELVKLPEHLADDPFLQEVYGQVYRSIHEIFFWYRGFFSGKCRDLFPQSPKQKAEMALLLAGNDVGNLAMMAENARLDGKLEWALELADDVLLLEPKNSSARKTKNEAMLALAGETINAQVRNYLLSEYLLETNQIPPVQTYLMTGGNPKTIFASMDENAVRFMPMYAVFRIMAVNLNASKSVKEDLVVGLKLIDIKKHKKHGHKHKNSSTEPYQYSLHVRKGIFESQPQAPQKAEFKIITDSLTWKDLVLGKLSPKKAVKNKDVIIVKGKPKQFYDFMDLFN